MEYGKYTIYSIRWLFVAVLWLGIFNFEYTSLSYGIVNNILSSYFEVSAYFIDLLASTSQITGVFFYLVLVLTRGKVGLRLQCIIGAASGCLGTGLSILGFSSNRTYALVLIGQALVGVSESIFYVFSVPLAANWFPVSERATVLGFAGNAGNVGSATAGFVSYAFSNATEMIDNSETGKRVRIIFMGTFAPIFVFLFASVVASWLYAEDYPPSPPTAAQQNIMKIQKNTEYDNKLLSNLTLAMNIARNRNFILITFARSLGFSVFALGYVLISSVVLKGFPDQAESFPGFLRIIGTVLAALSSLLVGRFLDRYGHYKNVCLISLSVVTATSIGLYFAHYFRSLYAVAILYPMLIGIRGSTGVSMAEMLLEVMYPANNVVMMALYYLIVRIFTIIFITLERLVLEEFDDTTVIIIPIIANVLSVILIAFTEPAYHRSNADSKGKVTGRIRETFPLVINETKSTEDNMIDIEE